MFVHVLTAAVDLLTSDLLTSPCEQEDEAGEGAGGSALENQLGRHSDEQHDQSSEEQQQNHTVTGDAKKKQTCLFTGLIFVLYLLSDCVCPCLQRGSNYGSLMTAEGNMQIFAKTGYYKVRFYC